MPIEFQRVLKVLYEKGLAFLVISDLKKILNRIIIHETKTTDLAENLLNYCIFMNVRMMGVGHT